MSVLSHMSLISKTFGRRDDGSHKINHVVAALIASGEFEAEFGHCVIGSQNRGPPVELKPLHLWRR